MTKRMIKQARIDPARYYFTFQFLFGNGSKVGLWLTISLLLSGFAFIEFFPDPPADSNEYSRVFTLLLYVAIYALIFWAVLLSMKSLSRIQIENAIAIIIQGNAVSELSSIRGKLKSRIELDKIEESFFPDNPNKELSMLRLGRLIIEEAKDRRFDSAVVLMDPYKEESVSSLFKINVIQKSALHLGILGTFIGLISAFAELGIGTDTTSLLDEIIPSLEYAFTTSIAGLLAAILISFFVLLVRRNQDAFFKHMEDATNSLLALARNANNRDDFFSEFTQINDSVKDLDGKVYDQTQEVKVQTLAIKNGLSRLKDVNGRFDVFLKDLSEKEKVLLEEVHQFHKILSPKSISEQLEKSLNQSVEGIATSLENHIGNKIKKINELDKSVKLINGSLEIVAKNLEEQQAALQSSVTKVELVSSAFQESLNAITKSQEDFIGKITGTHFSEKIREDFKTVGEEFGNSFSRDLKNVDRSIHSYIKQLNTFNNNASRYFENKHRLEKGVLRIAITIVICLGAALIYKLTLT